MCVSALSDPGRTRGVHRTPTRPCDKERLGGPIAHSCPALHPNTCLRMINSPRASAGGWKCLTDRGNGGTSPHRFYGPQGGLNVVAQLSGDETPASQKREERLRKFRELHFKRNEARKLNHQEVVEEDKRLKLPSNWEAKKARLEWELQVDEKRKECVAQGEDYDMVKLLEISAEDAERWERKKKKKNPDPGFSGYAEAQLRQYQRLTKQIQPDMENYERQREECGEDFHPTSNSLIHGTHIPSKESVDRMVEDVEKQMNLFFVFPSLHLTLGWLGSVSVSAVVIQTTTCCHGPYRIEKRSKYSRRRAYNDDADIDYINERNAKFNKKAERFYGKYTAEIKQNLERGTAV
ncbi:pre-mRNA-splicing factor syf2-like [Scleropages formosus]|uniref:Pre-mRNA-splicing factor SYF2 n=1 Tax=Scleropages formosus TaxID=113540 RepID=A0A0P7TXD0_SCLFO|nr:pre-mRNA-splicing factor syf2-like [Scleropages formosus]